jgi:carboxymethylenebutenolidase
MEIFGVHEFIKDVTRRLGHLGAFAIAPDYYFRLGDMSKVSDTQELMPKVYSKSDAELFADLDAAVAWAKSQGAFYGPLADKSVAAPKSSIELAPEIKEPVLGLYGEADSGISVDQVHQMEAALKANGKTAEIHIYPGAPHGFVADYRASYRKEAADDAWNRMVQDLQGPELIG